MKTTTVFITLAITIILFAFSEPKKNLSRQINDTDKSILINKKFTKAILKTSNGCGVGNFLIPITGDSSQNQPPILTGLSWNSPGYTILDTILGNKILGVAFKREAWEENTSLISGTSEFPYVVISDYGMVSYSIPHDFEPDITQLDKINFLEIIGINRLAKQTTIDVSNTIILLVNNPDNTYNIQSYSYPDLEEQFNFYFHFEPEIFEVIGDDLFISGQDTSGVQMLYHYSAIQDTLFAKYNLNFLAENAKEVLKIGNDVYILSSPAGIVLSKVNLVDSTFSQTTFDFNSGARATNNEFKGGHFFTFQPSADVDGILNKQIIVLNPVNNQMDTLSIDLELDYFKYPKEVSQSFGSHNLSWIGAKWNDTGSDIVYLNQDFNQNINTEINTNGNANYINATYGCWVSLVEYELNNIKFEFFPNPASSEITINLTGLVRGEQYKLDITDSSGKVYHTTYLSAYEKLILPIENLAQGIYFMNLNTGRNLITQKLIIQ